MGSPPTITLLAAPVPTPTAPGAEPSPPVQQPPEASPTPQPSPSTAPSPTVPDGQEGHGGSAPWWNINERVAEAINGWLSDLVDSVLTPVLNLLGRTMLATPDVTRHERVRELWTGSATIANTALVLFLVVGGVTIMTHESLHTRYSLKEILPRLAVGAIAANVSLPLASTAIRLANATSQAIMGRGVDPTKAAETLTKLLLYGFTSPNGALFLLLLRLVAGVLATLVLLTWVVRMVVVLLLVAAAPLGLVCHCLPQTEGVALWWWRAFAACLAIQLGQSLTLLAMLRVFFSGGGRNLLGLPEDGNRVVDLLVVCCLLYVLFRIPFWAFRTVKPTTTRVPVLHTATRIVEYALIAKTLGALGLPGGRRAAGVATTSARAGARVGRAGMPQRPTPRTGMPRHGSPAATMAPPRQLTLPLDLKDTGTRGTQLPLPVNWSHDQQPRQPALPLTPRPQRRARPQQQLALPLEQVPPFTRPQRLQHGRPATPRLHEQPQQQPLPARPGPGQLPLPIRVPHQQLPLPAGPSETASHSNQAPFQPALPLRLPPSPAGPGTAPRPGPQPPPPTPSAPAARPRGRRRDGNPGGDQP